MVKAQKRSKDIDLDRGSALAVYAGSKVQNTLGFHQKYLNLCSEDE